MRIIFAGTPDFAATHLQALLNAKHDIVGVFTPPDRPAGRGNKLMASPVKQLALQHNIAVFQPNSLRSIEDQQLVSQLKADLMIVVAYGYILPPAVLAMPKYGCFNVHGSLLPRWRGAAPIQRAIWAGDQQSGVTIMQMDAGLDTGDMLYKLACPIESSDTSASLYQKLAILGAEALLKSLELLSTNQLAPQQQNPELVTYAEKLTKEEARLDWRLPAEKLNCCIRAFNPWPVSYFIRDEQPVKVWAADVIQQNHNQAPGTIIKTDKQGIQVATGSGILNITLLQPAGKKAMSAQDLLNSRKEWFPIGAIIE